MLKDEFNKLKDLPPLKECQEMQKIIVKSMTNIWFEKEDDIWNDWQSEIKEMKEEMDKNDDKNSNKQRILEEMGDVVFVLCNLANYFEIDIAEALISSTKECERRMSFVEEHYEGDLKKISIEEFVKLWKDAKKNK